MTLEMLEQELAVCKLAGLDAASPKGIFFLARTDKELSLVCEAARVPFNAMATEGGWRALRAAGALDFGLVGILAELSGSLARAGISIFAVSTFDTDYILVKKENIDKALCVLKEAGHSVLSV